MSEKEAAALAIKLEAITRAEQRRAAHLQAAAGARCESERQGDTAVRVPVGQREQAGRDARDRAAKPFEIIKAMGHEVSQQPTATVAARLPAVEAQPCSPGCAVSGHDDVPQAPDRAIVEDGLGAPP